MHNATELGAAKKSNDHVNVIRHDAPGDQSIAPFIEVTPGVDDQLSDRRLAQEAFATARAQTLVHTAAESATRHRPGHSSAPVGTVLFTNPRDHYLRE